MISNLFYPLIKNDFQLINFINIFPRLEVWRVSLIAILEKPIFGWGATSFPIIYRNYRYNFINDNIQHTHNLFFEISINYGLIASILFSIFVIYLIINSFKKIRNDKSLINKAWWAASFSFLINQSFDVTYYDIRISMIFWILITGLNTLINENESTNKLRINSS